MCVCVWGYECVWGGVDVCVCAAHLCPWPEAAGGDLVDGDKEDDGLGPLLVHSLLVLRAQGTWPEYDSDLKIIE